MNVTIRDIVEADFLIVWRFNDGVRELYESLDDENLWNWMEKR